MTTPNITPLVSVKEAQRLLGGRGRGRIYALMADGEIDTIKDGARRLIIGHSLARYIARITAPKREKTPAG